MLLLEINKLIPLCHQLQTVTKTPLQNQVFLKVKERLGYSGKHLRNLNFHLIRFAFFRVLLHADGQSTSIFSCLDCKNHLSSVIVTDPREQ